MDTVREKMDVFKAACVERGVKLTHQRLEIYRALASTEKHPDVETVHRQVKRRVPTISLDTVYRNLKLLAQHGLVSVVGVSPERLRFDANMRPHHHFSCERCGLIRDFYAAPFDGLEVPLEALAFGEASTIQIEVRGVCRDCIRAVRQSKRSASE